MSILVTGGTGFIGSHTVVVLLEAGYDVVVVDNFYNSSVKVLDNIEKITGKKPKFYQGDVADAQFLETVFTPHRFEAILHFAGYKAVGESVNLPLMYYRNNLLSTIVLTEKALKYKVPKLIFSSSATVYGDQASPLKETAELMETSNPYGETKKMSERILRDAVIANPEFSVTLLRYFNPVGAHESALLGEIPSGTPNNLMPYITQVAKGKRSQLSVYGNDYPTVDGTGVRDFIHVVDLAYGHMAALKYCHPGTEVFNLGTGKGTSVLELIEAFKRVNQVDVPYKIVDRRPGDVATSYADVSKAKAILNWETKLDIDAMVRDAYRFEKNLND
jgi:UDP-glucose 4-epimerase